MANDLAKTLLSQMTLEEKAGQITQLPTKCFAVQGGELTGTSSRLGITEEQKWMAGSVLGKLDAASMRAIQKENLVRSRLGIPMMFMTDIIHGYNTIYPVPLALACTWDKDLMEHCARLSAVEGSAAGYQVTFSPMVDMVQDPRWGRVMESFGEDPRLQADFGQAMVRGYQGRALDAPDSLAACVKHFAGYGAAAGGRDYNYADISEFTLQNSYFPPFQACIQAGARFVMAAFESLNGVPATANSWLLQDILRKQMGFPGIVISDWGAVNELMCHGVASTPKDAGRLALSSGIQIEMATTSVLQHVESLVEEAPQLLPLLDDAVEKILTLKEALGLFRDPYRGVTQQRQQQTFRMPEMVETARKAAADSAVLLENNGVLPLRKGSRILLAGPYADSKELFGPWSIDGVQEHVVTVYEGLSYKDVSIEGVCQTDLEEIPSSQVDDITARAQGCDCVILALGEPEGWSGEAHSRSELSLPPDQVSLLRRLKEAGNRVVVLLFHGRPLDLRQVVPYADAILCMWFPGTEGGNGAADLLMGDVNPSGRLTMSFPHGTGQIPVTYRLTPTGRPKEQLPHEPRYKSHYLDIPNEPLYPFGYGLSYTTYEKEITDIILEDGTATVQVRCTNTGHRDGYEVIALYGKKTVSKVARPVKELVAYDKVFCKAGQSVMVSLPLPGDLGRIWTQTQGFTQDEGEFIIGVDSHQQSAHARWSVHLNQRGYTYVHKKDHTS